jgi:hypothetical protein
MAQVQPPQPVVLTQPPAEAPGSAALDETAAEMLTYTTAFQAEILEDKRVDISELERANLATIQCMTEQGVEVNEPFYDEVGKQFMYTYRVSSGENANPEDAINDQCHEEYQDDVIHMWKLQNAPTAEEMERRRLELIDCVRAQGLSVVDEDGSFDDILQAAIHQDQDRGYACAPTTVIPRSNTR